jgi:hypothetical protein
VSTVERRARGWFGYVSAAIAACMLLVPAPTAAECQRYEPVPPNEPTGIKGCEVYGPGTASMWGGPGIARNDCIYPWTDCQRIAITSLETGIVIVVTPTMYCDCWQGGNGPNGETARIVDLDPAAVAALGLDPSQGLFPVRVDPMSPLLPNTSMEAP